MKEIISFIFVDIGILTAIIAVTLMPLKFNLSIIPAIEKKMGVKLVFSKVYDFISTKKYGAYLEIASYIIIAHWFNHDQIDNVKLNKYCSSNWALTKINYPLEKISLREILWSYFAIINFFLAFLCIGIAILLN